MSKYIIDFGKYSVSKVENVDVSPTELKILSALGNGEFVDIADIARFINADIDKDKLNIRMHIHRLKQKGFKIEAMQGAHGKYKLFEEVKFQ